MAPPIEYQGNGYVDHELSVNLDSTDAFEGPEKLLEIWFFPCEKTVPATLASSEANPDSVQRTGLRQIPFDEWKAILKLVKCEILSIKSSAQVDAFLLSESSLFVFPHKLILKTCGTTLTLFALEQLFQTVHKFLGWDFINYQPLKVFYSRRSFMFPARQREIHQNWQNEVDYLNKYFTDGFSYLVGRADASHWYFYTTKQPSNLSPLTIEALKMNPGVSRDETFEVLMTGLNHACASQFVTSRKPGFEMDSESDLGHFLGQSTAKATGLDDIYETPYGADVLHDAFAFTPCGFSSNTLIRENEYYTLHITPEKGWSYASFESNVLGYNDVAILDKVLNVFKPSEFSFTLFVADTQNDNFDRLESILPTGYRRLEKIIYDMDDYKLLYVKFELTFEGKMDSLTIQQKY